MVDRTVHN